MYENYRILTINPGSTSTKVACFSGTECISSKSLSHSSNELSSYKTVVEQYPLRKQAILEYLAGEGIEICSLDAVVGRGGLLKPLKGGTYRIDPVMLEDLKSLKYGEHASNLGALIAYEISVEAECPSYIVNPVVVDEMSDIARYSGLLGLERKSVFHALNQKATAMRAARDMGKKYNELRLIVAHMGGGISVAAHQYGEVIDVNNGLEEGAFSPERTGSLPVLQLADLCFSGKYSRDEVRKLLVGKGGMVSYLGTADCAELEQRAKAGDSGANQALCAMAYQIAKEIGSYSTVLYGRIDAVILTGGLAKSGMLTSLIKERVAFIAPVIIYPGEDEMLAMAEGACRVLSGEEDCLTYV